MDVNNYGMVNAKPREQGQVWKVPGRGGGGANHPPPRGDANAAEGELLRFEIESKHAP